MRGSDGLDRLREIRGPAPVTVRYGPAPDQRAELWTGPGGGPRPVAALLHGGYWRHRYGLDVMNAMAADLDARGFAVWNLEYRRVGSPGGAWPATFEDVAAGLDALVQAAAAHPLDLRRLMVVGHSAGGHLALWLASRAGLPGGPGAGPRLMPSLVVSLAGVCDPYEAARRRLSQDAVGDLLGGGPVERAAAYEHAAPAGRLPFGVAQLLAHGTADDSVPVELSEAHASRARSAGDACRLLRLEGVDHFQLIDPAADAYRRVMAEAVDWLTSLAG